MQIGIYSPRPELLEQQYRALDELNETACLDLTLHRYANYRELTQGSTNIPLDVLLFDMDSDDAEEQIMRFVQTQPNCRTVLLSDSEKYAVFGYAVQAAGYLIMPLDEENFLAILIRLIREKIQAQEQFLPIKLNGVWSQVSMNHITYLESEGHNLIFHMNDGRQLKVSAGFKHYQSLLDLNADYVRCHKSYIVNMQYVKEWELDHFQLTDGNVVNISRPYWQTIRSVYACHMTQSKELTQNTNTPPVKEKAPEMRRR